MKDISVQKEDLVQPGHQSSLAVMVHNKRMESVLKRRTLDN